MKLILIAAAAGLAVAGLACASGGGEAASTAPAAGDAAPTFALPGSDGKTHSLEEHAGSRAVVLAWFPKAFTGG